MAVAPSINRWNSQDLELSTAWDAEILWSWFGSIGLRVRLVIFFIIIISIFEDTVTEHLLVTRGFIDHSQLSLGLLTTWAVRGRNTITCGCGRRRP
jgi:hypothetical protein